MSDQRKWPVTTAYLDSLEMGYTPGECDIFARLSLATDPDPHRREMSERLQEIDRAVEAR